MTYVIAAAGTGGHVYPAIAVAESLVDHGVSSSEIRFFGGERMEGAAVTDAGFAFHSFDLPRLRRSVSPENLRIPTRLRRAAASMTEVLDETGARVVLGMGGYVTVPASLAARRSRVPLFVQEQNSVPGLANRFAARRAVATFLGLPGPAERLPRSEVIGNPLRRSISEFSRSSLRVEARHRYQVAEGSAVLGVVGGSLGAAAVNDAVVRMVETWAGPPVTIVHLTGGPAAADISRRALEAALPWRCRAYEDRMDLFYAAADLVVCRAGAMTVSELTATGTPAVLIPLDRVGQTHNGRAIAAAGAAVVVPEQDVGRLDRVVAALLDDPARRAEMAERARAFARPHAAAAVARRLMEAADG